MTSPKPAVTPVERGPLKVRRLVTGEDEQGRSYFVYEGEAPNQNFDPALPSASVLWVTGGAAVPGPDPAPKGAVFRFHSEMGTLFRITEFPPDSQYDGARVRKFIDECGVHTTGPADPDRHFWWHKTHSLDYAICLEGEIYAMLDKEERLMKAGDVLIQRATNHCWSNRSDKPCRMAFILIDLEIEGTRLP
jgi:hypothetical protein